MHKQLNMIVLVLLLILFFSSPAQNVSWIPMGPNGPINQTDTISTSSPALDGGAGPGGRSVSDSLALIICGLTMLLSASFLRRLAG